VRGGVGANRGCLSQPREVRAGDTRAINDLSVAFDLMTGETALKAAEAWRRYRAQGGMRTRIASGFLIGAHAQGRADRLLTRDRGFFRRYFAGLKVLDPSRP